MLCVKKFLFISPVSIVNRIGQFTLSLAKLWLLPCTTIFKCVPHLFHSRSARSIILCDSLTHARTHTLKPIKTFNTEHSAIVCFHTNSLFCAIYYLHISCMFAHFVLHFAFLPSIQQSRLWYEGVRERERKNRIESNLPIRRYCLDSHESRRQQQTETKKNSLNSILNTYTKMAKVVKQTITRHFFLLV